jgi:hypothetical protein
VAVPEQTNKEEEGRVGKVTNVKLNDFAFLFSSCFILSKVSQGCFWKTGNSSLQIMYHMAVPEQTNKEKERRERKTHTSNSTILHFLFEISQGCFSNIGNLSLQIIHHMKASHFC